MAESGRGTIGDDVLENWAILGSGGFGLVLKATHKVLGRVAIKLLNDDDSSGTLYAALCREADHMEAADQQFVPRVYGMYRGHPPIMDSDEMQGIVMELMEGGCLESFLRKKTQSKPPPWPLAFRLAHQVAVAMDFLHCKKNLVHMDLKPANILLDADLNAKIADFGLSTVTNSFRSTNRTNKGGTLFYTPPEAFEPTYRRVRSYDVYSYGILLWTILTGESPYPGMDRSLFMSHVIEKGQRPDLDKIDVQKAAGLEELVELMQRCWDSEPNKRPSFAECVEVTRGVLFTQSGRETIGDDVLENWAILGSGGFGLVLKATHKVLGRVAIKLLNDDGSSGTSYAALCREADHMEAAAQQFVPRVYGMYRGHPPIVMDSNEMQGIVMELMEGGCLESFLRNKTQSKPPPWPLAFRLAHQVAVAMDFLHCKKNLVHMDLKPGNILLDANFNAKIADFGLSTVTNSFRSTNRTNKGGTLFYTPPEAFEQTYRRVRSYDVYSYGILLWTILTGESPYPVMDRSLLEFRVTEKGQRPDLDKIDVQKAAGLEELVELMQRCWDSEPNKRPSFAECVEVTRGVFSRHEEGISAACDLLKPPPPPAPPAPGLTDTLTPPAPGLTDNLTPLPARPVPAPRRRLQQVPPPPPAPAPPVPGSTNREAFLKHSSPLSLDPNTAARTLLLSENNRKVTYTAEPQPYADHPKRFTRYSNVLSTECISDLLYYEVLWNGWSVEVAVCQDDVNREGVLSDFRRSPQSWALCYYDSNKRYVFCHNGIHTEVSGPVLSTGGSHRVGVFVNPTAGVLCFYHVCGNTMSLLHTVRTTFTRPLYAGICVHNATAEVCEIW